MRTNQHSYTELAIFCVGLVTLGVAMVFLARWSL